MKVNQSLVFIAIFLLIATAALAQVSVSQDKVTIDVDYSDFTDEDQESLLIQTSTISLENPDPQDIQVTITTEGLPADYTSSVVEVIVPANGSLDTTFPINVSHSLNAGTEDAGFIIIKDLQNNEIKRLTIEQTTLFMLQLEELQVRYTDEEGESKKDEFSDEDDSYDLDNYVRPGSEVKINLEIKNQFDRSYDDDKSTIEDVTVEIEADDDDLFADDFEEEYDVGDIDAKDKKDVPIDFTVSEDAEAGDYTLDITITGEDGENARYRIEKELTLTVKRERNDVRITKAVLTPAQVACDQSATLEVEIKNFGSRDQTRAGITVFSEDLNLNENIRDLTIEEFSERDNDFKKTFTINLDKVKARNYPIDVLAYIQRDKQIDEQRIFLNVKSCTTKQPVTTDSTEKDTSEDTENDGSSQVITSVLNTQQPAENSPITTGTASPTGAVIATIENPTATEEVLLIGMLIAIVIIFILILTLFILLVKQ